jgi:hypothetical protein
MSRYTDLQELYTEWDDAGEAHTQKTRTLVDKFWRGLLIYLEAPSVDVVRFHKVNKSATGIARYSEEQTHFYNLIEAQPDGSSEFCISVTLHHKQSTLPNFTRYFFEIKVSVHEAECDIIFLNDERKSFNCKTDGDPVFEETYAYICDVLTRTFLRKPWEGYQKAPIGFAMHR